MANESSKEEHHMEKRQKFELKRLIEELDKKTAIDGHSTTLVSLIIPPGTPMGEVTELIRQELATAARIKSRTTRKNVQAALSSIQSRLRYWKEIPETGLIIYAGITQEGKLEYYEIVPPKPVRVKKYLCDSRFDTSVLKEMLEEGEKYGIILLERDEATIGLLDGTRIEVIKNISGYVPPKHSKGGQSARRFERLIEGAYKEFLKKVAEEANKVFLDLDIKGLIIGGPGFAKEDFLESEYLDYRLRQKILGKVTTQYLGEEGLREALYEARELIKESKYIREKEIVDELMRLAATSPELVAYGFQEVNKALNEGKIEKLIIHEELRGYVVRVSCERVDIDPIEVLVTSDFERKKVEERASKLCSKYGSSPKVEVISDDVVEYLMNKAKNIGAEVEFISSEGEIGEMFLNAFKGIAAILRYA
ncbi:MAG: peptide chain release factor aRF-1 [Candidatus Njordarchaeales archaeon]